MNLQKLYHPSGLPKTDRDGAADRCACGCANVITKNSNGFARGWVTAEILGIKDTPALRAIAEMKRAERKMAPKSTIKHRPWKGAEISMIEAPFSFDRCTLVGCKRQHVMHRTWSDYTGYSAELFPYHVTTETARVYRLPNGAKAIVRMNAKIKL